MASVRTRGNGGEELKGRRRGLCVCVGAGGWAGACGCLRDGKQRGSVSERETQKPRIGV